MPAPDRLNKMRQSQQKYSKPRPKKLPKFKLPKAASFSANFDGELWHVELKVGDWTAQRYGPALVTCCNWLGHRYQGDQKITRKNHTPI